MYGIMLTQELEISNFILFSLYLAHCDYFLKNFNENDSLKVKQKIDIPKIEGAIIVVLNIVPKLEQK